MLVVLGRVGYGDTVGTGIADRIVTSAHACFSMTMLGRNSVVTVLLLRQRLWSLIRHLMQWCQNHQRSDEIPAAMVEWLRENIGRSLDEVLSLTRNQLVLTRAARAEGVLGLVTGCAAPGMQSIFAHL